MFSNLPLRHQYGFIAIAGLFVAAAFGFGGHYLRQPAPIVAKPLKEAPPVARPSQEVAKEEPEDEIVVHVAGAVRNPSVVKMHRGDRVHDAIQLAGGTLPDADLTHVNLAAKVQDGTQLFVPHQRETREPEVGSPYQGGDENSPYGTSSSSTKLVNLNSASLAELDTLPGIGPTTAQKIIDYRTTHGPFLRVEELVTLPGVGVATVERIRPFVVL